MIRARTVSVAALAALFMWPAGYAAASLPVVDEANLRPWLAEATRVSTRDYGLAERLRDTGLRLVNQAEREDVTQCPSLPVRMSQEHYAATIADLRRRFTGEENETLRELQDLLALAAALHAGCTVRTKAE